LQRERDFPNVQTNAWLDFGYLVVERQLTDLYDEILQALREFRPDGGLRLPAKEYRYAAIQALLAEARGERLQAREFARQALAEATKDHSGLRYHQAVALVGAERATFENRLRNLAGI
jgi:hypothetical protein